ncbi:MAG TPA: nuclear transport factor 2 family protein [Vicinamibacterales bacterium]|nr:nuclear transport factor 2 family protein [Vicinamibacterales bacterium]
MNSLIVALGFGLIAAAAHAQTPDDDKAVRAVIQQYFKGHATGDPAEMKKAFHPTAHVEGNRDGTFVSWTAEQYAANFTGKPAADEATRKRTIDRVDISGDAAMVSATLVHGATTFTDYFVLLKINNEWKIANKVYSRRPTVK